MSTAPPPYTAGDPSKAAYPPQPGYGPQQPGYWPPGYGINPPQQHTTVIQQQPTVVVTGGVSFGESPTSMVCPYCQATIVTATSYVPGTCAWLICLVIFCFFWPCCFLPFVLDGCKDVVHSCPNCQRQVGVFTRL